MLMMSDNLAKYRRLSRRSAAVMIHCTILSLLTIQPCSGFIVYPKLLESRMEGGPLTLHVHPGLILNLEKSSIFANNLHFVSSSNENSDHIVVNGQHLERNLYHDATHMSSVIVEQVPRGVEVRGIVTYRHRIYPLVESRSTEGDIPHVIEEIEEAQESGHDEGGGHGTDDLQDLHCASFEMEHDNVKPQLHEEFIVEVCIVVSKNYSASFNSDDDLVNYVGAMFNWDDFLFRNESCGISTDIHKFGYNASVCGYNAEETINNTVDYIKACFDGNCDIVYHLTSKEIFLIRNGSFQTEVAGLTTLAGVCSVERFAVGEDLPHTYNGRVTVAHEIGHFVLPKSCINVSTSANYTNDFLPGENITEEQFCKSMHPGIQVIPRHKKDTKECHVNCCWNGTSEEYVYSEENSEEEYSDAMDESTAVYHNIAYDDYCSLDGMLDGMACGENKTCYRSECSNHNWTEIRLKYHTLRTFP
uniref:Reprolysin n=1 Tax=Rhipicephalus zambeziensis TaxID=60191 RepID=A0A224YPZ9_9ACAR